MAKKKNDPVSTYLARIGKAGGTKTGKLLTKQQRSERASKAAKARWRKETK